MEDENIVDLLYDHNEQGLIFTKEKYNLLLENLSFGIVRNRDDSEECVNDSYLKLWDTIPPYKPSFLRSFLCKITRQISIDKYRFNNRKTRNINKQVSLSDLDYEICGSSNVEDKLNEETLMNIINDFINNLDIESQTLFVNKYFLFKTSKEISEMFSINENYIDVKLYRIRKKLLKHLESEGYLLEKI
jgi:RNA polymerase sigma factor (sigma-70 family)